MKGYHELVFNGVVFPYLTTIEMTIDFKNPIAAP